MPAIRKKRWFIKLTNWEYWPFNLIYIPVFFYWIYLSVKARSLLFFSAANPAIESGGMMGESKNRILEQLSDEYKPKTVFISKGESFFNILLKIKNAGVHYPVIAKPDIGERGWKVEKIISDLDLQLYRENSDLDFLIQDFVDDPIELAVMYYRLPGEEMGTINSVTVKEFLKVTGDGKSTIKELMGQNPRAILQLPTLEKIMGDGIQSVPYYDEDVELVPIGNHCRGTKFLNGNHLIDEQMTRVFDRINQSTPGIYFCRYDLKCTSISDLKNGINIKVMEINGVGAEPAHIYDPDFKLWNAYKALFGQWKIIYKISRMNRERGVNYMSIQEAWETIRFLRTYKKNAA